MKSIFKPNDLIYFATEGGKGLGLYTYANAPVNATLHSVNPLSLNWHKHVSNAAKKPTTPRFSLNVSEFKNFIFECDSLPLEVQLEEWLKVSEILPIKRLTYSGGKSYHAIISVFDTLALEPHHTSGVLEYKRIWEAIRQFTESNSRLRLDKSTKDPSRLTRIPNAMRNGTKQAEILLPNSKYATSAELMQLMFKHAPAVSNIAKNNYTNVNKNLDILLELHKHRKIANKINRAEKWAAPENMYPELLRLTLWAIDELNADPDHWLTLLQNKVFPKILATGYKRDLTIPVKAAYNYKGIKF